MFVEYCLEKKQLERARPFTSSSDMMTITMLLGLLSIAWETAGKSKGFHFFQQYDDDYDALMFVEYCLESSWKE